MLRNDRKIINSSFIVAFFLVIAYFLRTNPMRIDDVFINAIMIATRNVIHITLLVAWYRSISRRIVKANVRMLLESVAFMMLLWLFVKIVKYEFCLTNTESLARYLWYAFYIPMVIIPLQGVFIMNYIGKPDGYRTPKWMLSLYVVATVLIAGVFTNDIHNLAFNFPDGVEKFDSSYTYGPLYYIIMAWFCLFGLIFVCTLLKKSRLPVNKQMQKFPLIVMLGAIVFWTLYCMRIIKCDLTVMDCIIITLLLESAIRIGLIPSNDYYSEVFNITTVPMIIVDSFYAPHYTSDGAMFVTEDTMREAENGEVIRGNYILHSSPIRAGRVIWEDDVTELNELKEELYEVNEQLDGENILLQAEVDLKEQQAKVEEKHRLYDRIASEVASQLAKMALLIDDAKREKKKTRISLSKTNVIGSYIKRRGNLRLIGEDNKVIPARELEYCLRESLDNLKLCDVYTSFNFKHEGNINLDNTMCVYDFYEAVVEKLLDTVSAMLVHLDCKDGGIKMRMQIGCTEEIEADVLDGILLSCGKVSYNIQDEDIIIDINVPDGGDNV